MGCNRTFAYVYCFLLFFVNVGPTARVSPELMEQAQHEFLVPHKCISRSCGTYQVQYIDRFCSLFHWWILSIQLFYAAAIGAAVDNQTDSQQFLYPSLCL
jgi:ABC-2 type transport system permease protein